MALNTAKIEKIDLLFKEFTRKDTPGCVLGIVKDGVLQYKKGYGIANLEYDIPISSQTVFCVASNSKQFTGMCIALLEEDGQLHLDDDIRNYIPEFPNYDEQVTVGNLLYHTSGIKDYYTYYLDTLEFNDNDFITEDEAIDFIISQEKLAFKPGEIFSYSNSNYVLLSLIVNRITGKSLGEFADERIFKVLGMKNTFFREMHSKIIKNRAVGYCVEPIRNSQSKYFRIPCTSSEDHHINMSNMEITGDDGVWTTMDDLILWDKNFYDNKLGGQNVQKRLVAPGKLNNGESTHYGYGIESIHCNEGVKLCHNGWVCSYLCTHQQFSDLGLSIIILSNTTRLEPWEYVDQIKDILLANAE